MTTLRVLFESRFQDRRAYCCADEESNFLILLYNKRTQVDSFVTTDFLYGLGHAYSFLLADQPFEVVEQHAAQIKPPAGIEARVALLSPGMARLDVLSGGRRLFTKFQPGELDAQMMGDSYLGALEGWDLAKKAPKTQGMEPLIAKTSGRYRAEILRFLPVGEGHHSGLALQLLDGDEVVHFRLRLFTQAIEQGNGLLPREGGSLAWPDHGEPPARGLSLKLPRNDVTGGSREPDHALHTGYAYEQAGARTVVARAPQEGDAAYAVLVYVDNCFITRVVKDQDQGGFVYTLPRAIKKAQDLLPSLVGWEAILPDEDD